MRMGVPLIFFGFRQRECDFDGTARKRIVVSCFDGPRMIFNDILNDTQTQSGPGMALGKERFEDMGKIFRLDTRPPVGHPDMYGFFSGIENIEGDLGARGTVLGRVIQQVNEDLLELSLVSHKDNFFRFFPIV